VVFGIPAKKETLREGVDARKERDWVERRNSSTGITTESARTVSGDEGKPGRAHGSR